MHQLLKPLYRRNPILHEKDIRQLRQMRHILDMFDLVETQIEQSQIDQVLETLDVADEVVVEVELFEGCAEGGREFDAADLVLAEAQSLHIRGK